MYKALDMVQISAETGFPVGPPTLAALARPSGPVAPLAAGRRAALARGLGRKLSMQWHTPPFDIPRTPMESSTWSLKLSLEISGRPKNSSNRKDLIGIPALQQYVEMRVNTLAEGSRSGCRGESRYGMVQLPGMSCRSVAVATSQQNTCS